MTASHMWIEGGRSILKIYAQGEVKKMMKQYTAPKLLEYGGLTELTLGQHGSLPDYNVKGQVIANDNCSLPEEGPGSSGNSNPFVCLTGSV